MPDFAPKPTTLTDKSPMSDYREALNAAIHWRNQLESYDQTNERKIRFLEACLEGGFEVPCEEVTCTATFLLHPAATGRPQLFCSAKCRRKAVRSRAKSERRVLSNLKTHPETMNAHVDLQQIRATDQQSRSASAVEAARAEALAALDTL